MNEAYNVHIENDWEQKTARVAAGSYGEWCFGQTEGGWVHSRM